MCQFIRTAAMSGRAFAAALLATGVVVTAVGSSRDAFGVQAIGWILIFGGSFVWLRRRGAVVRSIGALFVGTFLWVIVGVATQPPASAQRRVQPSERACASGPTPCRSVPRLA